MMKDPEFVEEYKALEPEYEILEQLLSARAEKKMTQREPAEITGIPQGHISRIDNAPGVFPPAPAIGRICRSARSRR